MAFIFLKISTKRTSLVLEINLKLLHHGQYFQNIRHFLKVFFIHIIFCRDRQSTVSQRPHYMIQKALIPIHDIVWNATKSESGMRTNLVKLLGNKENTVLNLVRLS